MKKLLFACFTMACGLSSFAQSPIFNEGDLVFNAGVGIGSSLYGGSFYSTTLPALSVSGEYGIINDFITDDMTLGVGGYLGFAGSKYEDFSPGIGSYGWRYNYTIVGARGAVHYPFLDKLDTYAGVMLGFNFVSVSTFGDIPLGFGSADGSSVGFSIYAGGRYYFTENFAGMAEIGYGIAYLNLGVAFKL